MLSNSFCLLLNLLETGRLNHPVASKLLISQALNTMTKIMEKKLFWAVDF